ncbi:MAG: UbiA family prenyltransferase [Anaerolineae bacterium]|jgi:1,4-dihydroxy-2-naphthoate octaprenyltransferase|nr:UbiA family prenyltransferase [Anaerolineae bacterium]MBT3713081.1 UbiA family prenyltransferase [Anaerolineae bacterium]MBT4310753.1 UbiA family prenyltransferase [Anaerolineae bacterium]MBT4458249.1 UbiA family prenyltransferase [Anaerolineae bacterium]MBT4840996.1 UbiA family prenyltransferase [Anaerolineae bacterium]
MSRLKPLLTFSNPPLLALAVLTYALGAGIARYLGRANNPLLFGLGFIWILLLFLAMSLLTIYFRPHNEPLVKGETIKEQNWLRAALFQVSIAALGIAALLFVTFLQMGVSPPAIFYAVLIFLTALIYALPPLRLATNGFGELALAVLIALLIPAFSLSLQMGEIHRLLGAFSFPLVALSLAYFLVLDFPTYKEDRKYERGNLLFRIGWQRAIPLHHILILTAYFLFATMPQFGFPWAIIGPVFLVMPFALFEIYWMQEIASGSNPNWRFLKIIATTVIGLTLYIITFTLWTR